MSIDELGVMYHLSCIAMQGTEDSPQKDLAYRYLKRLLPHVQNAAVADALAKSDKTGLVADIAQVGTILGTQFYRVRAPIEELLSHGSTLPALEVRGEPRLLLGTSGDTAVFLEGVRERKVRRIDLSAEPREFIIASPRMTLAALRGRSRVQRVLSYLATERGLLKALIVYAIFVEVLSLAAPLTVQILINTIGFGMMTQQLIVLSSILLIGLAGAAALQIFQQILVEHLSRRFFARTVMDYSERLPLVQEGILKNPIHRFFEVASVDKAFFVLGLDLIALVLQLLAATLLLSFYHPILLSFTVVMAVCATLVVRLPFKAALNRSLEESRGKYQLAEFLMEKNPNELERLRRWSQWEEAPQSRLPYFGGAAGGPSRHSGPSLCGSALRWWCTRHSRAAHARPARRGGTGRRHRSSFPQQTRQAAAEDL